MAGTRNTAWDYMQEQQEHEAEEAMRRAERRAELRTASSAREEREHRGRRRAEIEQAQINDVMTSWSKKSRAKRRQEQREGRHEVREARHCCDHCFVFRVGGPNQALIKTGLGLPKPEPQVSGCVCYIPCFQWVDVMDLTAMQLKVETNDMITAKGVTIDVSGLFIVRIDPGAEWSGDAPLPSEPEPEPEPRAFGKGERLLRLSSDPERVTGIRPHPPSPAVGHQPQPRAETRDDSDMCPSRPPRGKDEVRPFTEPKAAPPTRDPIASLRRAASQFAGWSKRQIEARVSETLAGHQRSVLSQMTVEQLISGKKTRLCLPL